MAIHRNKRLRIGLVLSAYPGYSETFFRNKIHGLQVNGHEVILFLDQFNKKIHPETICPVYALNLNGKGRIFRSLLLLIRLGAAPKKARNYWKLLPIGLSRAGKIKSLLNSSHILPHQLDWLHFGFLTLAIGRENLGEATNAKLAASIRGFDISIYPLKHPACYDLIWTKLNKLHTISDDLTQKAKETGMPAHLPVKKITPAIDTSLFDAPQKKFENIQRWQIVTVARLHWKKGLIHTLEAMRMVKMSQENFVWRLIGEGPELEQILFTIHQLGLQDHVILHGKLQPKELKNILAEAQIYLQYSVQEGFCNSVLEAQAMGLISVVSDAEGLSENIADQITGFCIPKREPHLLAASILNIMQKSGDELSIISQQAISRVQENFNLTKQSILFNQFYTESK